MTKGQPKCVAFFILVYIALVISRLIHTPHSSEHFLITSRLGLPHHQQTF